jgi:hypothetical protein
VLEGIGFKALATTSSGLAAEDVGRRDRCGGRPDQRGWRTDLGRRRRLVNTAARIRDRGDFGALDVPAKFKKWLET